MSEEQIKKATDLAYKEIEKEKNEKVAVLVKKIVRETLEKLDKIESQIKDLNEQKKQLKMTIDDLKSGRLDLLEERLEKDEKAKEANVIIIHKHKTINNYPSWNLPYEVTWKTNYAPFFGNTTSDMVYRGEPSTCTLGTVNSGLTLTSCEAKANTVGVYTISTGVVNLR